MSFFRQSRFAVASCRHDPRTTNYFLPNLAWKADEVALMIKAEQHFHIRQSEITASWSYLVLIIEQNLVGIDAIISEVTLPPNAGNCYVAVELPRTEVKWYQHTISEEKRY